MAQGQHITVELVGGAPWGFRLGGGADFGCPLEIAKIRKKSKAAEAGLSEGDVITSVDNQDVTKKSHQDAMKIIDVSGHKLKLEVIKGAGPSAQFSTQAMSSHQQNQDPIEATIVRSREPSISRSFTVQSREPNVPRTLTVLNNAANTVSHQQQREQQQREQQHQEQQQREQQQREQQQREQQQREQQQREPWRVDVTSYQVKGMQQQTALPQKPKFNAREERSSCPILQPWTAPPVNAQLNPVWQPTGNQQYNEPVVVPIKPMEVKAKQQPAPFKVSKIPVQQPTQKWQPLNVQVVQPQQQQFSYYNEGQQYYNTQVDGSSKIPPAPPFTPDLKKPANHIPGMVNPLIYDDSQGVFAPNTLINPGTSEENEDGTSEQKQRKIYSDSAFYDAPGMGYPTIHEQVALCKQIANFLESNTNQRSRGGRMFMKRKQKSQEWSMDSQGRRVDTPHMGRQFGNQFDSSLPTFNMHHPEFGYNQVRHHPDPIKPLINQAELEKIQHNRDALCKHDELPPNLAFDVNSALAQSHGKAAQIFAKRKERAEKYTVDENNVRKTQHQNVLQYQVDPTSSLYRTTYMSPWDAAVQGNMEGAFASFDPFAANITNQQPRDLNYQTSHNALPASAKSAMFGVKYKQFNRVQPPSGPAAGQQNFVSQNQVELTPAPKNRLSQMIAADNEMYSSSWVGPSQPDNTGLMSQSMNENYSSYPSTSMSQSTAKLTLRRPKEFNQYKDVMSSSMYEQRASSSTAPRMESTAALSLRRPKDYMTGGNLITNTVQYSPSALSQGHQYYSSTPNQMHAPVSAF